MVLFALPTLALAAAAVAAAVATDPMRSARARAADLAGRMTWEEKLGQLGGVRRLVDRVDGAPAFNATSFAEFAQTQNGQLGFGSQFNQARDVLPIANRVREEQMAKTRLGIPFITVSDSVNGIFVSGGTMFPGTSAMGSTWNPDLYARVVAAVRDENLAMGVKWVLSPEVDLARDPRNGRNGEMYGEDPYLVGEFATRFIQTMQERDEHGFVKVATTIKHFVYGLSSGGVNTASMFGGLHHILNDLGVPYLRAFRDADPLSLMVSYASIDQVPMSNNRYMVQKVLRGIMGFRGLIMSDAYSIRNLHTQSRVASSLAEAGRKALLTGLDHELSPGPGATYPMLLEVVNSEVEVARRVDEAVRSILAIKFATGTFDLALPSLEALNTSLRTPAHLELNREASREAVVLLANDGILPLASDTTTRMAVLGPYADVLNTGWYASNNASDPSYGSTIRRSLEARPGQENVEYAAGVEVAVTSQDVSGIPAAVAAAERAGLAVLVLGSGWGAFDSTPESLNRTDGEGFSHPDLAFPGMQEALLEALLSAGVPTVLVLSGGQTFLLPESTRDRAAAIIHSGMQGEFTADALVEILFGDVNPSGKLTVSFPQAQGAVPVTYDYLPSDAVGGFQVATDWDWHWPQLRREEAPFPFGFGLSYTSFALSNATVQCTGASSCGAEAGNITVAVTITNTGTRGGQEVLQLYFRPAYTEIEFPNKRLVRFVKVDIAAGASRHVEVLVPSSELGYYVDGEWHVDKGLFSFWVGTSSHPSDLLPLNATLV